MSGHPPEEPGLERRMLGYMLMAVGGLIALLSGGCTLFIVGQAVFGVIQAITSGSAFPQLSIMMPVIIFGGIPFAGGCALIVGGRRISRRRKTDVDVF